MAARSTAAKRNNNKKFCCTEGPGGKAYTFYKNGPKATASFNKAKYANNAAGAQKFCLSWGKNKGKKAGRVFSAGRCVAGKLPKGRSCISDYRVNPSYSRCKASSIWANNAMGVSHGRGRLDSPQGWSARYNRKGQWWQMDARSVRPIVGIETQRRRGSSQRVTGYKVRVSADGRLWSHVDNGKVFTGNRANNDNVVMQQFNRPVMARYVRIVVQTWTGHISLRVALLIGVAPCKGLTGTNGAPLGCGGLKDGGGWLLVRHIP